MSSVESHGDLVSDHGSQASTADSTFELPRMPATRRPNLLLHFYTSGYDGCEALLSNPHSLFVRQQRMRKLLLVFDLWFNGQLRGAKHMKESVEDFLENLYDTNRDEQIDKIVLAFEREQAIDVYPARKKLPRGENPTWDMRNGEERTQPLRGPRRGAMCNQHQTLHTFPVTSANEYQIQNGSQSSTAVNSSQHYPQVVQSTENNSVTHHDGEVIDEGSDPSETISSTSTAVFGNSPAPNRHFSTEPPDVVSNIRDSRPANEFSPETGIGLSSRSNDTMTNSGESIESSLGAPLTPSNSTQRNSEPFASLELGISLDPADPMVTEDTPGINDILLEQGRKENHDEDLFRDFIHDHMLDLGDE